MAMKIRFDDDLELAGLEDRETSAICGVCTRPCETGRGEIRRSRNNIVTRLAPCATGNQLDFETYYAAVREFCKTFNRAAKPWTVLDALGGGGFFGIDHPQTSSPS